MSVEEASPVGQSTLAMSVQRGLGAPSAGAPSTLQDTMSLTPLDSTEDRVQPFPRSPQLQRRLAKAALPTQEQLSKRMDELQAEKVKTEARIQSLKKRRADLATRTEVMKQQIHARFEAMRAVLKQDEQTAMETLDIDLKKTRTMLDQVLKTWNQHLDQVTKTISNVQKVQTDKSTLAPREEMEMKKENVSLKKSDASEKIIRLNEERFEKLVNMLSSVTKQLKVQLQKKTLLLDMLPVVVDPQTCHSHLTVASEGKGLVYGAARTAPEHPLQFDRVCCALGSVPVSSGQAYWEVDIRCCSGWAVGAAYGRMQRKGRDKGCKLGRNMNSWCVEFKNKKLSAWHNNRHMPCQGVVQTRLKKVGVWVQFDKGQLVFYDAETMSVLQSFSAAMTPVFDRAHHQFTEPLFPAVRFIKPDAQAWPNHMEFCHNPLN